MAWESLMRVHWVAVPNAVRARRVNSWRMQRYIQLHGMGKIAALREGGE
jgi:hypothetical protein